MDRFDDQFGDMDTRRQRDDRRDDLADVAWAKDHLALLFGHRYRALFKDGGVDFAGVDVRHADPFDADFVGHAGAKGRHCKFAGGVSDPAESQRSFSGDTRDVDDGSVMASAHVWQGRVDHVVGTGCIDGHDIVPLFRAHLADRTVLDVHSCCIDQDVDRVPLLAHLVDEVLDTGTVGHIEGQSDDVMVARGSQLRGGLFDDIIATRADGDSKACFGEGFCNSESDTGCTAGYNSDLRGFGFHSLVGLVWVSCLGLVVCDVVFRSSDHGNELAPIREEWGTLRKFRKSTKKRGS